MTRVGDIITFPEWSRGIVEINAGGIRSSQGAPGYWRVKSLYADGNPHELEPVSDEDADREFAENRSLSKLLIPTTKQ